MSTTTLTALPVMPSALPPGGVRSRESGIVSAVATRDISSATLDGFNDALLLARIAGRDRVAFKVFYQRHAGRILASLRHLCRDAALADDLLQEVFIAVWRKAGGYRRERGDVGGWLFTVCRNKVIDARRRGRLPLADIDVSDLTTVAAPPEPRRDLRLSLHQALATLSLEQREAVTLTYLGGFTYDETAARLDVPLGTLKSRLRAGIQRLRRRLGEGA